MTRTSFSDSSTGTPGPLQPSSGRLVVLEGLPGAGKTTLAHRLATAVPVVAEYTTPTGQPVEHRDHPPVHDDDAHQANWLTKTHAATDLLARAPVVVCDRDWLSALAYAYSTGNGDLLERRCAWALRHLRAGALRTADVCVRLDVDPAASLSRRTGTLRRDHPWSDPAALRRLSFFYRNPERVLPQRLAAHLPTTTAVPADRPPKAVHADVVAILEGLQ